MNRKTFIMRHRYIKESNCMKVPLFIHIELTRKCPLECKQCYGCYNKENEEEIAWETCADIINQASEFGIEQISLTGGEPLLYSHLYDCLELIRTLNMYSVISSSGVGLNKIVCNKLFEAGLYKMYISLNGSTPSIHNLSRSHYESAIQAIKTIKQVNKFCGINWVARNDNIEDFYSLCELSVQMGVDEIVILANKKNAKGVMDGALTKENEKELQENIERARMLPVQIQIDPCYEKLNGIELKSTKCIKGCMAGRSFCDVLISGEIIPCRHLESAYNSEKSESLQEWWKHSVNVRYQREEAYMKRVCQEHI